MFFKEIHLYSGLSFFSAEYCEQKLASLTTEESFRERLSSDYKRPPTKKKNSLDIPLQCKLFLGVLVVVSL